MHTGHQGCYKAWVSIWLLEIAEAWKSVGVLRWGFFVRADRSFSAEEMLPGLKFRCPFYVGLKEKKKNHKGFLPV